MKYSIITLAVVIAAFVLGCQDPSATGPAATGDIADRGAIAKPHPVPDPSQLQFDQEAFYINSDRSRPVMQGIGTIDFHITELPILYKQLFDVEISVKGQLYSTAVDQLAWSFGGASTDQIRIPSGTKVCFTKTFVVYGAGVPTVLTMEFTVTEKVLAFRTMSLIEKEKDPVPATLGAQ